MFIFFTGWQVKVLVVLLTNYEPDVGKNVGTSIASFIRIHISPFGNITKT